MAERTKGRLATALSIMSLIIAVVSTTTGVLALRHQQSQFERALGQQRDQFNRQLSEQEQVASRAGPLISMEAWLEKLDPNGQAVMVWSGEVDPPAKEEFDGSPFVISALVTNSGRQAVDVTWITVQLGEGVTMARQWHESGPNNLIYRVPPIRIEPFSQVGLGIRFEEVVATLRNNSAWNEKSLRILVSVAGLPDLVKVVPFDLTAAP